MKGFSECCDALIVNGFCADCGEHAEPQKYDCDICQDTGEVSCMEAVYPGEPHMADVGTQKCECQLNNTDEE